MRDDGHAAPHENHDEDVEDDDVPCYRHPERLTALHCVQCDRPMCTDCAIQAPVGLKCPECGRLPKEARGAVPTSRIVSGTAAAAAVALAVGTALASVQIPFEIILAYFGGVLVGVMARRGSGGFRDPLLARIAALCAGLGVLAPLLAIAFLGGSLAHLLSSPALVWPLLGAAAAAWGAHNRASR